MKYVIESVLLIGWSGAFLGAALAGVFVVPVAPAVMMGAVLRCERPLPEEAPDE